MTTPGARLVPPPTTPDLLVDHARTETASPPVPDRFRRLADRLAVRRATVGVVGLGYVGLPLLLEAARAGCDVVGVDTDLARLESLRARRSYLEDVADADLAALGRSARLAHDVIGLLTADVVVITVPTPLRDGVPDLTAVRAAAAGIAEIVRPGQLVVLESTTFPGTTEEVVRPILEGSGLRAGTEFALAYSPERIDPGTGRDPRDAPRVVAGIDATSGALASAFYGTLGYRVHCAPTTREAELAKLIENTFRQVNIALVNELAVLAADLGIDIWAALDAAATKPFGYLPFRPGPGVGGHCIAIDPSYLSWRALQHRGFGLGFVQHALEVNHRMPAYVASRVADALNDTGRAVRGSTVLALGVAYKPGVADTRESPSVAVVERLLRAGARVEYHDPHVEELDIGPVTLRSVPFDPGRVRAADCVVVLTAHPGIDLALLREAPLVFDAVGVTRTVGIPGAIRL